MRRHHDLYKCSRGGEITCLSFPEHFFCHGCDVVEDIVKSSIGTARRPPNRSAKRFRCTGGHDDLAYPTTLKKGYRPKPAEKAGNVQSSSSADCTSTTTTSSVTTDVKNVKNDDAHGGFDDSGESFSKILHDAGMIMTPTAASDRDLLLCDPQNLFTSRSTTSSTIPEYNATPSASVHSGSSITPSTAGVTTASSISSGQRECRGCATGVQQQEKLKDQITVLARRRLELERKNISLETKILQLLKVQERSAAAERKTNVAEPAPASEESKEQPGTNDVATAVNHRARWKERRHCLPGENAEASHKLSILIQDFISKGDLANRRNFPEPRLGKIIIDSVASFEWTHSEMWSFAKQQRRQRTANDDTLTSALLAVINRKRNGPDRGDKTKAVLLIKCTWDDYFLNGEAKACMIDQVRQYLRQHVFSPWRILKAMDIAGFQLSLAGIEVLRNVENSLRYG